MMKCYRIVFDPEKHPLALARYGLDTPIKSAHYHLRYKYKANHQILLIITNCKVM